MTALLAPFALSEKMLKVYRRDGYVVIPQLFAPDEIAVLRTTAERELPGGQVLTKQDRDGNKVSLKMWGHAGDDIYGMFSRNERVVGAAERVIGEEVYLYSAKMILKDAREGGAWEWHQDYG
ncbi:MAG TPA: phytanoyl-CoA dioxygenase family protein, partial [Rhizomicrobium sp.]|nr:phytanoyl-CoA dioxygenase family protein [Rhizomicrobium sp.]